VGETCPKKAGEGCPSRAARKGVQKKKSGIFQGGWNTDKVKWEGPEGNTGKVRCHPSREKKTDGSEGWVAMSISKPRLVLDGNWRRKEP